MNRYMKLLIGRYASPSIKFYVITDNYIYIYEKEIIGVLLYSEGGVALKR